MNAVTPGPTLSTVPANSAAGENGKAGLILIFAGDDQRVEEIQRGRSMRTTASPAPASGSAMSANSSSSGVP